jgi:hypothetical protein
MLLACFYGFVAGLAVGGIVYEFITRKSHKKIFDEAYVMGVQHGHERERVYRESAHMLAVEQCNNNPRKFEVIRGGKE